MHKLNTSICNEQNNQVPVQVAHMGEYYPWDDPNSVTKILAHVPLAVKPNLQAFHLDPLTNPTDIISQGYIITMGLLVSEAFCEATAGCVLQAHERHESAVVHRGQRLKYFWLHFIEELEERIDYASSHFAIRRPGGAEEAIDIANAGHLHDTRLRLVNTIHGGELAARRLVFLPSTPRFDLCCVHLSNYVFFVSDGLAARLSRRHLTGFEVLPATVTFG